MTRPGLAPPPLTEPALAALIIENARDYAIFTMDTEGLITSWSPGAERITGYGPTEAIGMNVARLFTEPDQVAGIDRLELDTALEQGRAEDSRWHVRSDGEWFWSNGVLIAFLREGAPTLLKILRDETAAKLAMEHRVLLLNELNHRIKNTLATVQSIVEQTLRSASVEPAVRETLTGRLIALSSVHDVLVQESWAGASLAEVVDQAIAAYRDDGSRFVVDGPPVRLSPVLAVSISLALHELATNALKYGGLSAPQGQVSVSWTDAHDGAGRRFLTLLWKESGGPKVSLPTRNGFGARLLQRVFAESGGSARLDYDPAGLLCVINLPLSSHTEIPIMEIPQDPRMRRR